MILDGGYKKFDYLVLDEVHTLNGPEGDALQRIIKACNCPVLALSATIGNAAQLRDWFVSVHNTHVEATLIDASTKPQEVILQEYFARFINLQRYVVTQSEGKDGKPKQKIIKLHPVAAMTPERLKNEPELIAGLSMTPSDLMDLWKRMRAIFPSTVLEDLDDPDKFFAQYVDESKRVTLNQTKEYENHLKKRLASLSESHPDLFERLRKAQLPPPLESKKDVSDILYGVVDQLKQADLLPAVAFQLNTYGAFNMFKTVLKSLESEQVAEFPNYRKDLIKLAREKAQMRKVAAGKASKKNEAEAEEEAKSGFVDDSLVQEDTTKPHDKYVLSAVGKRLSHNEVEDIIADMKKSGETVDINHALIRGLRRGIAIYTNEVGFACYRRQVQMLAQKGRLAVVFSDEALAYGVNMPFRSCIFCGDMGSDLSPLIAQQMQGRAGRRGLDVQGSVIYLGMDWPYIENLMLGQISHVTGKEPRYPTSTFT
jgi:ATP-dependent RNA helicase DDX60